MEIRVNHCIVFNNLNPLMTYALIHINDVVCCSLDIGGCIAAGDLVYSFCSLLTYSIYFISFDQIIVLQLLQLYVI